MPLPSANIRQAIIDVLESNVGVLQIDAGMFAFGVFEGQPTTAKQSKAMQAAVATHRFDVQLSALRNNDATNVSVNSSRRIAEMDVAIPVWTHVKTTAQETERKAILASIESDCADAIQVLAHPGNLAQSAAAGATGIVSGMMLGPGTSGLPHYRTVNADWQAQLVRSEIVGSVIVTVPSLLPAPDDEDDDDDEEEDDELTPGVAQVFESGHAGQSILPQQYFLAGFNAVGEEDPGFGYQLWLTDLQLGFVPQVGDTVTVYVRVWDGHYDAEDNPTFESVLIFTATVIGVQTMPTELNAAGRFVQLSSELDWMTSPAGRVPGRSLNDTWQMDYVTVARDVQVADGALSFSSSYGGESVEPGQFFEAEFQADAAPEDPGYGFQFWATEIEPGFEPQVGDTVTVRVRVWDSGTGPSDSDQHLVYRATVLEVQTMPTELNAAGRFIRMTPALDWMADSESTPPGRPEGDSWEFDFVVVSRGEEVVVLPGAEVFASERSGEEIAPSESFAVRGLQSEPQGQPGAGFQLWIDTLQNDFEPAVSDVVTAYVKVWNGVYDAQTNPDPAKVLLYRASVLGVETMPLEIADDGRFVQLTPQFDWMTPGGSQIPPGASAGDHWELDYIAVARVEQAEATHSTAVFESAHGQESLGPTEHFTAEFVGVPAEDVGFGFQLWMETLQNGFEPQVGDTVTVFVKVWDGESGPSNPDPERVLTFDAKVVKVETMPGQMAEDGRFVQLTPQIDWMLSGGAVPPPGRVLGDSWVLDYVAVSRPIEVPGAGGLPGAGSTTFESKHYDAELLPEQHFRLTPQQDVGSGQPGYGFQLWLDMLQNGFEPQVGDTVVVYVLVWDGPPEQAYDVQMAFQATVLEVEAMPDDPFYDDFDNGRFVKITSEFNWANGHTQPPPGREQDDAWVINYATFIRA